jgi:hypothetical protein
MWSSPFEVVNALDFNQIEHLVEVHQITDVYLMAALYRQQPEKPAAFTWDLNMNSLFMFEFGKENKKIFWP